MKYNGILGPASTYPATLQLSSAKYTQFADPTSTVPAIQAKGPYYLSYRYLDPGTGKWVSVSEAPTKATKSAPATPGTPTTLQAGWNVITPHGPRRLADVAGLRR